LSNNNKENREKKKRRRRRRRRRTWKREGRVVWQYTTCIGTAEAIRLLAIEMKCFKTLISQLSQLQNRALDRIHLERH
jgi:hypothetical protein